MMRATKDFRTWSAATGLIIGGMLAATGLLSESGSANHGSPEHAGRHGTTAGNRLALQDTVVDEFAEQVRPFLEQYCLKCHTGDDTDSGLDLDRFNSLATVGEDLETWADIVDAVESDYMPPDESAQPKSSEITTLRAWYYRLIADQTDQGAPREVMRRLNRTEYENTVRDLLRLKTDVFDNPNRVVITDDYFQPASGQMPRYVLAMSHHTYIQRKPAELPGISELPVDPPVEHGFNNDQSTLSFSPVYLEACLTLAHSILNDVNFPRQSRLWRSLFVADATVNPQTLPELARQRLATFLPRAFRRPVTDQELNRYSDLFVNELENGDFTSAMKTTVAAILASPRFLFRSDRVAGGAPHDESWAMASRLSYFLWGSMPDDELFQAAAEGRLRTNEDLRFQLQRMLDDRRCKSLSVDFGMQWLKLAKVNSARPDKDLFPGWYRKDSDSPGVSMMIEQLLLFETIMVENRSILEFIDADFGYLNRQLMDWYYIDPAKVLGYTPDPEGFEDFFRIQWPDEHRGGIVTSGAMLVSTSATTRTSPVYRGTWILDVVFNRPPPPPPPDVPALNIEADQVAPKNIREKLARHREDPTCAVCHNRIDPAGFALEKFDPVARFRKNYRDGVAIDTSGVLLDEPYDGAARFKNVILKQKARFVRGFVEHVTRYALGRELQVGDEPELERIAVALAEQDYRFRSVIEEVVLSRLFRSPGNRLDDAADSNQTEN